MPTAPVDSKGTKLFFADTGAPTNTSSYTTLVVFHGSGFNGRSFDKVKQVASAGGTVRLVLVNRREYAGSTGYTNEEIDDLKAGRRVWLERIAAEVAQFLKWFIKTFDIPPTYEDEGGRKNGGLSVMGWSMGAVTALSILGQPDAISKDVYDHIEPYFRQVILYDPADFAMGYDFRDPSRVEGPGDIARWITSYYIHPDIDDRAATYVDPTKPPSIEGITHEEMAAMNEDEAKMRSDFPLYIAMGQLLIEQADKVLYDETLVKRWFPKVEIVYLDCKQTIWDLAYCRTKVEKRYREIEGQRRSIRSMRFIDVEGANHCVHLDLPQTFWSACMQTLSNR